MTNQNIDIDALFAGMAKADASGRGGFTDPGVYEVKTKNIFAKHGHKGRSFIVEYEFTRSNNEKHKVGSSGSWVLKFEWPATFGHITRFVYALIGLDPADKKNLDDTAKRELAEKYAAAMCGSEKAKAALGAEYEDGMFIGQRLKLETSMQRTNPKPGKPEGGDFTAYAWAPPGPAPAAGAVAAAA
jgi:hypothetical protein